MLLLLILLLHCANYSKQLSVNIVGLLKSANGLGQVTINLMNIYDSLTDVFFIDSRPDCFDINDLPQKIYAITQKKNHLKPSISIFTDQITVCGNPMFKKVPQNSIKFAYSMVESTQIPSQWVDLLNKNFDAILVPDNFLIDVYKKCGIKLPIFELPLPILGLQDCYNRNPKQYPNNPFVFGTSALLAKHKNIDLLIKAFAKEFENNSNVFLRIHGYGETYLNELSFLIKKLNLKNILITVDQLDFEKYIDLISSWDCMVLLSKGEGFSITPRLAMGLGIPCILSNNTAHKTLCNTGLTYAVKSSILEASPSEFYSEPVGNIFNCIIDDVRVALRIVYNNYDSHLKKAAQSKIWVQKYLPKNLSLYYQQLIKPKSIEYGSKNIISEKGIVTNSQSLIKKYKSTFSDNF